MARLLAVAISAALVTVAFVSVLWLLIASASVYGLVYGGWRVWSGYQRRVSA